MDVRVAFIHVLQNLLNMDVRVAFIHVQQIL
jgi:hypothetical protein